MTGLNWIFKNYLLKSSGYKLMFLVQNVLLSLWLWSAEHFERWMGEVVKSPSALLSKWLHSPGWEAALQFPPAMSFLTSSGRSAPARPCPLFWDELFGRKHQHLELASVWEGWNSCWSQGWGCWQTWDLRARNEICPKKSVFGKDSSLPSLWL